MIRKTLISAILLIIALPCYSQYLDSLEMNYIDNDSIEVIVNIEFVGKHPVFDTVMYQDNADSLDVSYYITDCPPHPDGIFYKTDTLKIKECSYKMLNIYTYLRSDTVCLNGSPPDSLLQDYSLVEQHSFEIPSKTNSSSLIKGNSNQLNIYPNPATKNVYIDLTAYPPDKYNINIYSANGQKVKVLSEVNNIATIDISDLPDGAYFIEVTYGNKILGTSRFLKKKL